MVLVVVSVVDYMPPVVVLLRFIISAAALAKAGVAVVVIKHRIYTNNERHHMADPSTMLASGPAGDISLREAPAQGDGGTLAPPLQQAEPYCRGRGESM